MQCSAPLPGYHLTDTTGKTLARIKHTYSWPVRLHGCIISPRTTSTRPYLVSGYIGVSFVVKMLSAFAALYLVAILVIWAIMDASPVCKQREGHRRG